jgi:hypothetical protein
MLNFAPKKSIIGPRLGLFSTTFLILSTTYLGPTTDLAPFEQYLETSSVKPYEGETLYKVLDRWPSSRSHPAGPIEPKSWSAINYALSIPADVCAVRLFLYIKLSNEITWTWHKTFDISSEKSEANRH